MQLEDLNEMVSGLKKQAQDSNSKLDLSVLSLGLAKEALRKIRE